MKYGIEKGQIYLAADGSRCGHIVEDVETYADVDDVVVRAFTGSGIGDTLRRIDCFKLAMVRYTYTGCKVRDE